MKTSGLFPVEGMALSQLVRTHGLTTGFSVLDDFLPWQGLPMSSVTLLEGVQASHLARKLVGSLEYPERAVWIHSLKHRPFFHESDKCFRLQVPEDADILKVLPEVMKDRAFSSVIVQLQQPLPRAKALELYELARVSEVSLILVGRQIRSFPWELAELVLEAHEDFVSVRKAQNRPVPLWIPVEMLESHSVSQSSRVRSTWYEIEPITG